EPWAFNREANSLSETIEHVFRFLDTSPFDWIVFRNMARVSLTLGSTIAFGVAASMIRAQDSTDRAVSALTLQPAVTTALAAAKDNEPQTIGTQIRLTEVPAPPFKEAARAEEVKRLFQQAGLR